MKTFARFYGTSEIICELCKILEISHYGSKELERFRKNDELSLHEYKDMRDMLIERIASVLCADDPRSLEAILGNALEYYESYTSHIETLGASQKQLDFATLVHFVIPLVAPLFEYIMDNKREGLIIDRILPEIIGGGEQSAVQKALAFITNDVDLKKYCEISGDRNSFENIGYSKILTTLLINANTQAQNPSDIKSDETLSKSIASWLNGSHKPNYESIQGISQIATYCENLSPTQISSLLHIAKLVDGFFNWAGKYFGKELCEVLIAHYRLMNVFGVLESREPLVLEQVLQACVRQTPKLLDYYEHDIFAICMDKSKIGYDCGYKHYTQALSLSLRIAHKHYFEYIDFFVPSRAFAPTCSGVNVDLKIYLQSCMQALINPKTQHIISFTEPQILELFDKSFESYAKAQGKLFTACLPHKPLNEKAFTDGLEEVESLKAYKNDPYLHFMQGRFYAHKARDSHAKDKQKELLKKAQEHYLNALEYGKGVMGENYKKVVEEGMAVSANLTRQNTLDVNNAKAPLSKFYKSAYFLGLVSQADDVGYLVQDFRHKFTLLFHKDEQGILEQKRAKKQEKKFALFSPNHFAIDEEAAGSLKIDFTKPNKMLTIYPNPISQLAHTCRILDVESSKRLIELGADVNWRKDDGGSVLIFALHGLGEPWQHHNEAQKQKALELCTLLIPKMSQEALNTRLRKRKHTALSLAISLGLVEVVKLLLDSGADMDAHTCDRDNQSALYYCLQCITWAKGNMPDPSAAIATMSKEQIISASKGSLSESIFDDETLRNMYEMSNHPELWQAILAMITKGHRHFLQEYYAIFDLLLESTSNVDNVEKDCNGFTPLLFATEIGEVECVKKLLSKGANKEHKNSDGYNAYAIAEHFHHIELMSLLR